MPNSAQGREKSHPLGSPSSLFHWHETRLKSILFLGVGEDASILTPVFFLQFIATGQVGSKICSYIPPFPAMPFVSHTALEIPWDRES